MDTIAYQGKSLIKTTWDEVSPHVAKIDPEFARLVNELSPGKEFPLYLAYYRYGDMIGDDLCAFIPNEDGQLIRLKDPNLPEDVIRDLGYGSWGTPFTMVLDKSTEWACKGSIEPLLFWLRKPGDFFSSSYVLDGKKPSKHTTNKVLTTFAGACSAFMLPCIGEYGKHQNLCGAFGVGLEPAKELHQHGALFKEIAQSALINCDWRCCLLYFSESWVDCIIEDKAWREVRLYLMNHFNRVFAFQRSRLYYDVAFSLIQKQNNLRLNPYLLDTAKHLLYMFCGELPGFRPATDENLLPLQLLQSSIINIYRLEGYFPTIMEPAHFNHQIDQSIYYSIKYPSVVDFTPPSSDERTLAALRKIAHMTKKLVQAILQSDGLMSDTMLASAAQKIKVEYYHNQVDNQNTVKLSVKLAETDIDERFKYLSPGVEVMRNATIATDSPFMRGCIKISSLKV